MENAGAGACLGRGKSWREQELDNNNANSGGGETQRGRLRNSSKLKYLLRLVNLGSRVTAGGMQVAGTLKPGDWSLPHHQKCRPEYSRPPPRCCRGAGLFHSGSSCTRPEHVNLSTDGTWFIRDHPTVEKISNDDRNISVQGVFTIIYNVIKACTTSHIDWRHTELHYNIQEHKM